MTRSEFLDTLRRRLSGVPAEDVDDVIADYDAHFADGVAAGRSEAEIASALGDPIRLARELRAEAGFRRWETERTPANFRAALFGLIALLAVDFILLLPVLVSLCFAVLIAGIVALSLCLAGIVLIVNLFGSDLQGLHGLTRTMGGVSLLGFGIGGGALLLLLLDWLVRALGHFARLHYTLLNQADLAGPARA